MTDEKPRMPIRRFDVFAECHRLKNEEAGMPEYQAKGRALWAAKVVAGRRYGTAPPLRASDGKPSEGKGERAAPDHDEEEVFRSVGGVPQTDQMFDKEIVDRMGRGFYDDVFHPAIARAVAEGKRYEDIRDSIRKDWK